MCFQAREGEDGLLVPPGERVGGGAAGGQSWERAAAGLEETDPAVQQSQSRHGLSHPGSVSFPTAAQKGTLTAHTAQQPHSALCTSVQYDFFHVDKLFSL